MDEHEPPASWDQQEEDNSSITSKLANLNDNAISFVPSFGSQSTNIPTPSIPKTPPSTPVVIRHINENETENLNTNINQIELNDQLQMEQDFPTKEENELIEDENDSLFLISFFSFN
jgi:hypothetical protein